MRHELRKEGEEKERRLRIQDIDDNALPKDAAQFDARGFLGKIERPLAAQFLQRPDRSNMPRQDTSRLRMPPLTTSAAPRTDCRRGHMNERAHPDAKRRDRTRAPAQTDAAARHVEHRRPRYRQHHQGRADKEQKRRMTGDHCYKTCRSGGRDQDRFPARDHNRVLVVRGEAAICGAIGPAILIERNFARASRNNRLNRDNQPFG